jgi:hypothetical protein
VLMQCIPTNSRRTHRLSVRAELTGSARAPVRLQATPALAAPRAHASAATSPACPVLACYGARPCWSILLVRVPHVHGGSLVLDNSQNKMCEVMSSPDTGPFKIDWPSRLLGTRGIQTRSGKSTSYEHLQQSLDTTLNKIVLK